MAAVLCIVVITGSLAVQRSFNRASPASAQVRLLASNEEDTPDSIDASEHFLGEGFGRGGKPTELASEALVPPGEERFRTAEPAADAEVDYEKKSASALSSIRDSLAADATASTPNDDEGPSMSFGLDGDGLPTADFDYQVDADSFGAMTPSFGGFDAGSASTQGVDGSEPSSPQTADSPDIMAQGLEFSYAVPSTAAADGPGPGLSRQAVDRPEMMAEGSTNWSVELDGDGDHPTHSPPTVPKVDSVELSFPMLAANAHGRNTSGPAVAARSTTSVPDGGTVLLGGIQRQTAGQSEHGASGESAGSSPMTRYAYGEPESGGETQESAGTRTAALGDRLVVENGPASSLELPALGIESQGSGQQQGISWGKRRSRESTEFSSPSVLKGSLAAGEVHDRIVVNGGIVADSGGNAQADESGEPASAEYEPEEVAEVESNAWSESDELAEAAPSRPSIAGIGGGARRSGSQDSPRDASFETKDFDADKLADALPGPTTEPQSSREDIESMEDLTVIDGRKEEVVKERITVPSADDISLHVAPAPAQTPSYSIRIPEPVADIAARPAIHPDRRYSRVVDVPVPMTGTAIGQPPSVLEGRQATQDKDWSYDGDSNGDSGRDDHGLRGKRSVTFSVEDPKPQGTLIGGYDSRVAGKQAKLSLGKLAELSDFYKNTEIAGELQEGRYYESDTRSWYRRQSGLGDGSITTPFLEMFGRPSRDTGLEERGEVLRRRDQLATSGRNRWDGYVPPMLADNSESMKAWGTKAPVPASLNEKAAQEEAFSTFSLHVGDVSFKLARAALASGQWPEAAKVRIEEFVNAFDYGDPMPSRSEKVSCQLEQSIHPFLQQRNLLRISMRTAAAGRSSNTPLRLTFVLDNSGSMERIDRRQTVRRAFALLVQQLKPIDQVTLISFARQPRLLSDKVRGDQSHQLVQLIADLPSEGGTNIEAALQLAFEKAKEQQTDGAQNRIILLTDGAVNLGDADPESLSQMITTMRGAGIAFDAAGICAEGLNDEVLEALTRKGDGRYYLLDSLEAADDGFARQIAGALRPSAKNVKVQVEFNPKRVGRYKLLGFEKHRLKQEDFRNDSVDAAEMAAAEAGVAMYQFEAKPDGEGDVGSVSVRFRDLSTGEMIENRWPIPYEAAAPRPDQAAPSLRIATSAALLAAKLRGEVLGETVDLKTLSDLIAELPDQDRDADRVRELHQMIQQARQLSGE